VGYDHYEPATSVTGGGGGAKMKEWLQHLWLWEIWTENRATFKVLCADMVMFLFLMVTLEVGHYFVKRMTLADYQRELVETLHFNFTITIWLLIFIMLVAEITIDKLDKLLQDR
jgi:hypothetical protein